MEIDKLEIGGWWYCPETCTVQDVQGRTVALVTDPTRGVKMAAAEELVRGMRQVEILARDSRLDPVTRVTLIAAYAQSANEQLQRDLIASLPTAAGRDN